MLVAEGLGGDDVLMAFFTGLLVLMVLLRDTFGVIFRSSLFSDVLILLSLSFPLSLFAVNFDG